MNNYGLDTTRKQIELDTVRQIIHNNKFNTSISDRVNNAKSKQRQDNKPKRWPTFTYIGKETRQITKHFRKTKVKVAYTTKNNLEKLLNVKPQNTQQPDKYEKKVQYSNLVAPRVYRSDRSPFPRKVPRTLQRLQTRLQ